MDEFESALGVFEGESGDEAHGTIEEAPEILPEPGLVKVAMTFGKVPRSHRDVGLDLIPLKAGLGKAPELVPGGGRIGIRNQAPLALTKLESGVDRVSFSLIRREGVDPDFGQEG